MATQNLNIDTGLITFRYTNNDDEVIAKFTINPTDIRLMKRCEEVSKDFEELSGRFKGATSTDDVMELDRLISEKIDYMLGTTEHSIFDGLLTATTFLPDGRLFSEVIMDTVLTALEPEILKRNEAIEKQMKKYTDKYKTNE